MMPARSIIPHLTLRILDPQGLPKSGPLPPAQGNISLDAVTVRHSAVPAINPSTPWPWLFAFSATEFVAISGHVSVETSTPELVCEDIWIVPKKTAVELDVKCRGVLAAATTVV